MTTEQKIRYIQSFYKLVVDSKTYKEASSHAGFVRGLLAAWNADSTIPAESYRAVNNDVNVVLELKLKMAYTGGEIS